MRSYRVNTQNKRTDHVPGQTMHEDKNLHAIGRYKASFFQEGDGDLAEAHMSMPPAWAHGSSHSNKAA